MKFFKKHKIIISALLVAIIIITPAFIPSKALAQTFWEKVGLLFSNNGKTVGGNFTDTRTGTTYSGQDAVNELNRRISDPSTSAEDAGYYRQALAALNPVLAEAQVNKAASIDQEFYNKCLPGWLQIHFDWCFAGITYEVMKAVAFIFWIVGVVFDFVIDYTVIKMASNIKAISALNIAWTAFRDLANIFFIFILLYIAIATILQLGSFDTKKLLVKVIIVALLINFSLFFTKVIIDASNQLAYAFYTKITLTGSGGDISNMALVGPDGRPSGQTLGSSNPAAAGLADAFLGPLQLTSIYTPGTSNGTGQANSSIITDNTDPRQIVEICLLGIIVISVAAMVFLAACIIFVVRFLTLIILMMFSALAFMGMILPQTSKHSSTWWTKLFAEALVAPAFFMMIWVTIAVIGSKGLIPSGGFATFATGGRAAAGVVLNFALVIGLLAGSLIVSKLTGASGGALALNAFNGMRNATQGFIGRNTIGEIGRRLEDRFSRSGLANTPFFDAIRSGTTRRLAAAKFGSGSSRDDTYKHNQELRSRRETAEKTDKVREVASKMRELEKKGQINSQAYKDLQGEGQKYAGKLSPAEFARAFEKSEYQDRNLMSLATFAQVETTREKREDLNEHEKDIMGEARFAHLKDDLGVYKRQIARVRRAAINRALGQGKTQEEAEAFADQKEKVVRKKSKAFDRMNTYVRAMNTKEFELLHEIDPEMMRDNYFAPSIRSTEIQNFRKNDNWTAKEADEMRMKKAYRLVRALESGVGENIADELGNFSNEEVAGLRGRIRNDPRLIRYLDSNQVSMMINKDSDDIKKVAAALSKEINDAIAATLAPGGTGGELTSATMGVWNWMYHDKKGDGQKFLQNAKKAGIDIPDFDAHLGTIHEVNQKGNQPGPRIPMT